MGNKINPLFFRNKKKIWFSRWFFKKKINKQTKIDFFIRKKIMEITNCKTQNIIIERLEKHIILKIYTSGFIYKKEPILKKIINEINIKSKLGTIILIKRYNKINTHKILENLTRKIEKRENYKIYIKNLLDFFIKKKMGIKIIISGRIGGIEIARKEVFKTGKLGTSSIKNKIDYSSSFLNTKYGIIGIKVLINNEKKIY
ncbi:hypothetical protein ACWNX6_00745 [Candidatus Vidania fulgoroideorum]